MYKNCVLFTTFSLIRINIPHVSHVNYSRLRKIPHSPVWKCANKYIYWPPVTTTNQYLFISLYYFSFLSSFLFKFYFKLKSRTLDQITRGLRMCIVVGTKLKLSRDHVPPELHLNSIRQAIINWQRQIGMTNSDFFSWKKPRSTFIRCSRTHSHTGLQRMTSL